MQSSRLIVKNFGPLKDVDIEVRDFLCLIGKQATGKSTIAKLIAIFEDENFSQYFFIENLMDYGTLPISNPPKSKTPSRIYLNSNLFKKSSVQLGVKTSPNIM